MEILKNQPHHYYTTDEMNTLRVKRYTSFLSTIAGLDGKIMLKSEILMKKKQGLKFWKSKSFRKLWGNKGPDAFMNETAERKSGGS